MRTFLIASLLVSLFFASLTHVEAQTLDDIHAGGADPLTISVNPQYPRPYETITITPGSTLLTLAEDSVVVSVNGTVISNGSGGRSVTYRVGGPGSAAVIKVTAIESGTTYTDSLTVTPADVALITEALSSSHPLYAGASLPAPEGKIRIVALPDLRTSKGARIPASSLSYTWKVGDRLLTEQSGIGRSVLIANAPVRYRDASVSVVVSTSDESVVANAVTTVTPTGPLAYAYRDDPLLGPDFANAILAPFTMSDEEETFRAVAYHFAGAPTYTWTLNGASASSERDITVRTSKGSSGNAALAVEAVGQGTEVANTSFTVNFSAAKSIGIFGL